MSKSGPTASNRRSTWRSGGGASIKYANEVLRRNFQGKALILRFPMCSPMSTLPRLESNDHDGVIDNPLYDSLSAARQHGPAPGFRNAASRSTDNIAESPLGLTTASPGLCCPTLRSPGRHSNSENGTRPNKTQHLLVRHPLMRKYYVADLVRLCESDIEVDEAIPNPRAADGATGSSIQSGGCGPLGNPSKRAGACLGGDTDRGGPVQLGYRSPLVPVTAVTPCSSVCAPLSKAHRRNDQCRPVRRVRRPRC